MNDDLPNSGDRGETSLDSTSGQPVRRTRSPLPVARPATGNKLPALTNREIEAILTEQDVERIRPKDPPEAQ